MKAADAAGRAIPLHCSVGSFVHALDVLLSEHLHDGAFMNRVHWL